MNTAQFVGAIAMDLKRVAAALQRESFDMARELMEKTNKTKDYINLEEVDPYVREILGDLSSISKNKNRLHAAETALMYGTLLQNYSLSHTKKN